MVGGIVFAYDISDSASFDQLRHLWERMQNAKVRPTDVRGVCHQRQ